jgi:hypothetical protein
MVADADQDGEEQCLPKVAYRPQRARAHEWQVVDDET